MPSKLDKSRDRFTALQVRNFSEPGLYHDGGGLYLQIARGGSRSWIYRFTLHKKTRDMGIGSADTFSLADARARAQRHRQLVADGIDPIVRRDQELAQAAAISATLKKQGVTFQECAKEYHLANAPDWKNAKHADQWINTLTTYVFPKFGKKMISAVGIDDIRAALLPIWKEKAETASRVFQRIRTVINYGAAMGYTEGIDAEKWIQLRKHGLPMNSKERKVKHHSSCPYAEVGSLLQRVSDGPSMPAVRLAFEFTVLTAARSGEARGATWGEFDMGRKLWVIPGDRMKAGRVHTVPLSHAAWDLLEKAKALSPHRTEADHLVFPNAKGEAFSDMTFTQLLRRMKVPYVMHGFRASFRTWGAETTDYEHGLLEFALAHVVGSETVDAYLHTTMVEKRRQLMADWAQQIQRPQASTLSSDQV